MSIKLSRYTVRDVRQKFKYNLYPTIKTSFFSEEKGPAVGTIWIYSAAIPLEVMEVDHGSSEVRMAKYGEGELVPLDLETFKVDVLTGLAVLCGVRSPYRPAATEY